MVGLTVVSGIFIVGYCISRIRTKRSGKAEVQTLFGVR